VSVTEPSSVRSDSRPRPRATIYSAAVVLRGRDYGESDKIVTFLSRDFGKLTGIAKGALRSRRRFVGSLEPLTTIRLGFRERSASDLCFVESAEILRAPRNVGRDLDRYAYSTYVIELIDCMVEGREAEPAVFELAEETLSWLDATAAGPPAPETLRYFETRLLGLAGFSPRLGACVTCGAATDAEGARFYFNPRSGSLRCDRCSDGSGVPASAAALAAIARLRERPLAEVRASAEASAGEVRVLLQTFIAHHARRPLRSPALLREIIGL
jgi:DNA repair protein RecO (recombination protein O)